ncbi:hypothetical protein O1611_g425 [Lasiodiplodia mahajangana]|uniref:Uncharacterized protein n=1 Tax=Lasiodiplodia mahajangana TaxID=1108764 RepID=A0ACC2K0G4_9PEZI|nr:hypothetical protein O1611_g425 [Lasiodiplodia mahajangana]
MLEQQPTSPGSPLSSFPQFARFPPELRIKIWETAMDEPRTIHFLCVPDGHIPRTLMINDTQFVDAPMFFFVNRECREIAVKQHAELKALFTAQTNTPGYCFPALELNLLIKDGDKFKFHGILPCYSVFSLEGDKDVMVQWDYPSGSYDVPHANRWLESLSSGCNTGETKSFPDADMSCTMKVQQQRPPYFAFDMPTSNKPVWTCDLVENREAIIDGFLKWESEKLIPHLIAWMRSPPLNANQPLLDDPLD